MQPSSLSLQSLRHAMQEALALQDWSAIGSLDSQCRILVDQAVGSADVNLLQEIEELSQLYQLLLQAARSERERIASELTQLSKSKRADQAYKSSDR